VRLEGLGKLKEKKSFTSSSFEPAASRLVAWLLNHYATACPVIIIIIMIMIISKCHLNMNQERDIRI
jgi:hypothetical protein